MKGLYIHIPFCIQKCRYCDFVSYTGMETEAHNYISSVIEEMEEYRGEEIDTVFIGGGTPTILPYQETDRLLKACFERFKISSDCEFTAEANPGTLDTDKVRALKDGGVNRISVGVQSFNDGELKKIGRIHDAKTAYNTIWKLSEAGFSNINIDLMTSLPNQTVKSLAATLNTAMKLPITHISAYSLIIEDGTPIAKEYHDGELTLPDEDADREMYEYTIKTLAKNGFNQYEISNFAKQGCECRHNIKYWQCREYIGLGAAAHSYLNGKRFYNTSELSEYMSGNRHTNDIITLTEQDKISEFMIMGLRMNIGISENEFKKRFKKSIDDVYKAEIEKFIEYGFLVRNNGFIRFSDKGRNVSNSILCEFV